MEPVGAEDGGVGDSLARIAFLCCAVCVRQAQAPGRDPGVGGDRQKRLMYLDFALRALLQVEIWSQPRQAMENMSISRVCLTDGENQK